MSGKRKKCKSKRKSEPPIDEVVAYYTIGGGDDRTLNSANSMGRRDAVTIDAQPAKHKLEDNLLSICREQWQVGDWDSLSKLSTQQIKNHPDRSKLALLAAAGCLQVNEIESARHNIRHARKWGCSKKIINKVLISGAFNSLGRANLVAGNHDKADTFFRRSLMLGTPGRHSKTLVTRRQKSQVKQIIENANLNSEYFVKDYSGGSSDFMGLIKPQAELAKAKNPHLAEYYNATGESQYKSGNYKVACEYFFKALEIDNENAWFCQNLAESLARLKYKEGEVWECPEIPEKIERAGKWDAAVRYYRSALKLDAALVKAHQDTQKYSIISRVEGHINDPIFIVGCGHSGTSLMLALLGNHSDLYPIPRESAIFLHDDEHVQMAFREWDEDCVRSGTSRWIEKTPPHIFQIQRFLAFRPRSKFIVMLRDGRDVVCSLKNRQGYVKIEDRLDRWIYDNIAGMAYWSHPQVKVVKYEDLISSTEIVLESICEFLEEPYEKQMLDYHKNKHYWYSKKIIKPDSITGNQDHDNLRNWQINQPIFDGRSRWTREMSTEEQRVFKSSAAQSLLEKFGYVSDASW